MIKHQEVNKCFLCLFSLVARGRDQDIECRKEKGDHMGQFLDNASREESRNSVEMTVLRNGRGFSFWFGQQTNHTVPFKTLP